MTFKDASQAVADAIAPVEAKINGLESDNANLKAQLAAHENGEGELSADQAAALEASIDRLKTLGS